MLETARASDWRQAELASALGSRRWLHCGHPFPHVLARDAFQPELYQALAEQMSELLALGLSDTPTTERFSRSMPGYDAFGIGITPGSSGPMSVFVSHPWRDLMCGVFGIGRTPYVFAGAHHHLPGSSDGFVHNDFNPVWFPRATGDELVSPRNEICDFKSGEGSLSPEERIEVVRGAVVIYFLLNDDWCPGDGGETGFYEELGAGQFALHSKCPPLNNSLLMFECTPHSFHGFLANQRIRRTSIIMWVHRSLEEAERLYGEGTLEGWET